MSQVFIRKEKEVSDSDGEVTYGEFQSPKSTVIKRSATSIVPNTLISGGFKRKELPMGDLDDIDDDFPLVFEDDVSIEDMIEEVKEVAVVEQPVKKGKQETQHTRWCFTYNNPKCTGDEFKAYLEASGKVKLAVFQLEKGEEGTLHFQGYMETEKERTTSLQKMLGIHKCSLLYAKGTKLANEKYCTKEDTREDGPWYVGNPDDFKRKNGNQGKRSDMDEFAMVCIEAGGVTEEIEQQFHGHAVRFQKQVKEYVQFKKLREAKEAQKAYWIDVVEREKRGEVTEGQKQRKLTLLFGPTAVGKTTFVMKEVLGVKQENLYTKSGRTKWWDGYEGENNVLIDEFNGNEFGSIEMFNDMTNVGCFQVETKGSQTLLTANCVYIASNKHPVHWWTKGKDSYIDWSDGRYRAMVRRFHEVRWWNNAKELVILRNPGPENSTEEWAILNQKWVHFWKGQRRLAEDGDVFVVGEDSYFTF